MRVGDGDLREFLIRLNATYRSRNGVGRPKNVSLVTAGHSLGGQVLFRAVSSAIESDLIAASGTPVSRDPIGGIGDITVLINPALEAYQFDRIDRLSRKMQFPSSQTPVLVVVSGRDDSARRIWFPLSRYATSPFRAPFREGHGRLWHTALGEYVPQRTHRLELSDKPATLDPKDYRDPGRVLNADFSGHFVTGGAELAPIPGSAMPYSPFVIAYSSNKLIQGHNGIFTKTFRQFLTDYVAFVEGKRVVLKAARDAAAVPPSTGPNVAAPSPLAPP